MGVLLGCRAMFWMAWPIATTTNHRTPSRDWPGSWCLATGLATCRSQRWVPSPAAMPQGELRKLRVAGDAIASLRSGQVCDGVVMESRSVPILAQGQLLADFDHGDLLNDFKASRPMFAA